MPPLLLVERELALFDPLLGFLNPILSFLFPVKGFAGCWVSSDADNGAPFETVAALKFSFKDRCHSYPHIFGLRDRIGWLDFFSLHRFCTIWLKTHL
jgi:hypothetical protein